MTGQEESAVQAYIRGRDEMSEHTNVIPGMRWHVDEFGMLLDSNGSTVADLYEAIMPREFWPLVSAAPELLEALKGFVGSSIYGTLPANVRDEIRPLFNAARAAIARAEGHQ